MIRLAIFDLDGTLYRGDEPIPGAPEAVHEMRSRGILVRFLTNNSALSREAIAAKLTRLGFECSPEECEGTGPAAAEVCVSRGISRAMVVGEPGLHEVFEKAGIRPGNEAVVAGICRDFHYRHIHEALQCFLNGAAFIATNRDGTYPREGGRLEPGAGCMVAALEAAAGREPLVIGKPEPFLVTKLMDQAGAGAHETLMIGDRYETDILTAQRAGCLSWMVLTGVTTTLPDGQPGGSTLNELLNEL